MPYATPAALRAALEARLASGEATTVPGLERLRRRATFERLLIRLEHAMPGQWVLKGGMALEVRLGDRARSTRDLDLAVRQAGEDAGTIRDHLLEARTEEISRTDRVTLRSMLSFAGFPDHEVEAVDPAQHFAEKLHAFTRPHGDRANSRVKDLPDLLLLMDQGLAPTPGLLATVHHVFAVRSTHELPASLPDPPADWAERYATLADELGLEAASVEAAMARLRQFWAATLAAGQEEAAG